MRRAGAALVLLAGLAGCSRQAETAGTAPTRLPRPSLRAVRAELQALAARADSRPASAPASAPAADITDLLLTAYGGGTSARTAKAAEASLAELAPTIQAPVLESLLADEHEPVRAQCAWRLGGLRDPAAIPSLLLRLKYETSPDVRLWVGAALARLGNGAGLLDVALAMRGEPLAQSAGAQALEILKAQAAELGPEPTYAKLEQAVRRLHAGWVERGMLTGSAPDDPRLVGAIARALLLLDGSQLRQVDDARYVVQRSGRAALGPLRLALTSDETYLRNHALEIVRDLGKPARELEPRVVPLLGDPLSAPYAATALGAIGASTAAPLLLALRARAGAELRTAIAQALGPCGDPASAPALAAWLADPKCPLDERVGAAFSLALLEPNGPGRAFLEQRLAASDYHEPTLRELLARLPAK